MTTPQRPYLLRALYEWIVDNDETPYVLVDTTCEGVSVPHEYVQDGQIVLNIGPNAVRDLVLESEFVMCSSRFAGRSFELVLPMGAIRAIYCKDSGEGMVFPDEAAYQQDDATAPSAVVSPSISSPSPSPTPSVVEDDNAAAGADTAAGAGSAAGADKTGMKTEADDGPDGDDSGPDKPRLRLV